MIMAKCAKDTTASLRSRFQQHGIAVEVSKMDSEEDGFLLKFEDSLTARKVFHSKEQFELLSVGVIFPKRALPGNHVKYEVLVDAKVYKGKSLKWDCVDTVKRGTIVTANQSKNRRVRLIEEG